VPWLQPTLGVNCWSPGSSSGRRPPGWLPHSPSTCFHLHHDNSGLSWTVSVPVKGTAGPVERLGALQTLICAKRCPTSSNPALLPSWTVVCLSFTLLTMLLLPCWPIMGLNRIRKKKKCNVLIRTSSVSYTLTTVQILLSTLRLPLHQSLANYSHSVSPSYLLRSWQRDHRYDTMQPGNNRQYISTSVITTIDISPADNRMI